MNIAVYLAGQLLLAILRRRSETIDAMDPLRVAIADDDAIVRSLADHLSGGLAARLLGPRRANVLTTPRRSGRAVRPPPDARIVGRASDG
jgi:hypothetical protein